LITFFIFKNQKNLIKNLKFKKEKKDFQTNPETFPETIDIGKFKNNKESKKIFTEVLIWPYLTFSFSYFQIFNYYLQDTRLSGVQKLNTLNDVTKSYEKHKIDVE